MPAHIRFLKFQGVGAIGIGVQLAALALFRSLLGFSVPVATGLAVETAILHNFFWHERWTWKSETGPRSAREILILLAKFHLGAGGVSLVTNIVLTTALTASLHLPYLVANLISIGAAGVLNFLVADKLVFSDKSQQ